MEPTPAPAALAAPTTTFRRRAGAAAVLVAPLLFTVAELSWPDTDGGDQAAVLAGLAAHRGQLLLAVGTGLLAAVLFIPALFSLMTPVRGRGTALTHLGGGTALLGVALSGLALGGVQLLMYEASAAGVDRVAVGSFLDRAMADPIGAPLVIGHYLFALGLVVLAGGLFRARAGYRWASAALGAGPLLDAVLGTVGVPDVLAVGVVTDLLVVAGAAGLAWWQLTTSNAAWEGLGSAAPAPRAAVAA
jgi:hypothetical protein